MKRHWLALMFGLGLAVVGIWFGVRGVERAEAEPLRPATEWRLEKAEALTPGGGFTAPVWSPDGSALAFVSEVGTHRYSFADKSLRDVSRARAGYKFVWLKDGDALAYRFHTPNQPLQIQRLDLATGRVTMLAQAADLGLPQETGDGRLQFRNGAQVLSLNADSGQPAAGAQRLYAYQFRDDIYLYTHNQTRKLTNSDGQYFLPQVSPDGQKVIYQDLTRGLYVADLVSGVTTNLGPGNDPAWSPDSRFVVFAVTRDDGHNLTAAELFVTDLTGRRRQLTNTPALSEMNPSWSPDGQFIAFDADGAIYRAAVVRP